MRFFNEEIAGPVVEVGSEDTFDEIENLRVLTDVVQVGATLVPFADILGGFAVFEERKEFGQLGVDLVHCLLGKNGGQAEEVAVFVIEGFLLFSELVSQSFFKKFFYRCNSNSNLSLWNFGGCSC